MGILSDSERVRNDRRWKRYLEFDDEDISDREDQEIAQYIVSVILGRPFDYYAKQIAVRLTLEAFPIDFRCVSERNSVKYMMQELYGKGKESDHNNI